jgi:hypothetical protein
MDYNVSFLGLFNSEYGEVPLATVPQIILRPCHQFTTPETPVSKVREIRTIGERRLKAFFRWIT